MASLKGAGTLWSADVVSSGDASDFQVVGVGPHVAVYISTDKNVTFKVQASAGPVAVRAGLNEIDTSDPNGGLTWYDYLGATSIAISAGNTGCFDLSPFAPPYIRLVAVTASTATVSAIVSSTGPS